MRKPNFQKQNSEEVKKKWYKLDLSANVYPTLQRQNFSSVFRLSAIMSEPVVPTLLQKAADLTLKRFPSFTVMMKRGLFWRYLEPNHKPGPYVMPDISNPCMPMPFSSNNGYLIRLYYYDCRISLEVFHSLADGGGAIALLKTWIAVYLRLLGHKIPCSDGVLDINESPHPDELEDAYIRYANSKVKPPRSQAKAYRVQGTTEPFYTLNIICAIIPVDELLTISRKYKVSLTEYLIAVLIYSLLEKQKTERHFKERPVKIALPVNLRRFFPSPTLRNFIAMVYPSIDPRLGEYTFDEIVKQTHHFMRYELNSKFLNANITTNASLQQNPIIRIVPLFVKDIIVKQFYKRVGDKQSSAGLTNLGQIIVPKEMSPFIQRFDVLMGQPFSARTNCAIASHENTLTVNFASCIVETDVERIFFCKLKKDGVSVKIESNRIEV